MTTYRFVMSAAQVLSEQKVTEGWTLQGQPDTKHVSILAENTGDAIRKSLSLLPEFAGDMEWRFEIDSIIEQDPESELITVDEVSPPTTYNVQIEFGPRSSVALRAMRDAIRDSLNNIAHNIRRIGS